MCGLKNVQIQKRLLTERDLTFKKAFETAQSVELAIKEDFCDVSSSVDESVNKVGNFNLRRPPDDCRVCFRCGIFHHLAGLKQCSVTSVRKGGHLAKMCSSQKRELSSTR